MLVFAARSDKHIGEGEEMKKLEAIAIMLMMLVPIFIAVAMVFGLLSLLFDDPGGFMMLALYVALLAGIGFIFVKSKILQSTAGVVAYIALVLFGLWFFGALILGWLYIILDWLRSMFS